VRSPGALLGPPIEEMPEAVTAARFAAGPAEFVTCFLD
jgi:hypothetical protein